jgi:2,3-dihydroxyphenylpropionate 1,2-dioxygenase
MSVSVLFASHTPLKDYLSPGAEIEQDVEDALAKLRKTAVEFDPDLVVAIGPDHFNGFFYQVMPSFCVGMEAYSVGDWNTPEGPVTVERSVAEGLAQTLLDNDVDAAISHRMSIDHGFTQLLAQLFAWPTMPPIVPIFINCAGHPLPSIKRVIRFGSVLGKYLSEINGRVLITASGGLSHDPPIPDLETAPEAVRERLISGGRWTSEERSARQERVLSEVSSERTGESQRVPLNPDWDRRILSYLQSHDFDALESLKDGAITKDGGCGGHEIRTWVMAAACAHQLGVKQYELLYYKPIPEWIAGYGVMRSI